MFGMFGSIGKQSWESVEKKWKAKIGFTEKEWLKPGVKDEGVVDDDSGGWMEPMEEVLLSSTEPTG